MSVDGLSFDRLRLASVDARVGGLSSVATDDHARGQLVVVASGMAVGKLGVVRYELCTDIQIETSAAEDRSVDRRACSRRRACRRTDGCAWEDVGRITVYWAP